MTKKVFWADNCSWPRVLGVLVGTDLLMSSFGRLWTVKDPDRTPLWMGDGCTSAGLWQQLQRHRKLGSKSNQPTSEVLQALGVSQTPRPPLITGGTAVRARSVPPGFVLESYHHRFYSKWTRNFVCNTLPNLSESAFSRSETWSVYTWGVP